MPRATEKPRRSPGDGSVFQRKDGRWVASLELPFGSDGRRRRWTTYHENEAKARKALRDAIKDRDQGRLEVSERTTLAVYLTRWLGVVERSLEAKTAVEYRRHVEQVLVPRLGKRTLAKLTPMLIQETYSTLLDEGKSATWVRRVHATLHKALADAVRWDVLGENPASRVTKPREDKRERLVWTPDELRRFLDDRQGDSDLPLYLLAVTTGLRAGELFALQWSGVDLGRGVLTVRRSATRVKGQGIVVSERAKTAAGSRLVALPALAVDALGAQRERVAAWRALAGGGWRDEDLVFPQRDGSLRGVETARRKLHLACERLGLPDLRFHDLRHLHASLLLAQGTPIKTVQARLGHSSIQVTLDLYGHLLEGADRQAADALGAALAPPESGCQPCVTAPERPSEEGERAGGIKREAP